MVYYENKKNRFSWNFKDRSSDMIYGTIGTNFFGCSKSPSRYRTWFRIQETTGDSAGWLFQALLNCFAFLKLSRLSMAEICALRVLLVCSLWDSKSIAFYLKFKLHIQGNTYMKMLFSQGRTDENYLNILHANFVVTAWGNNCECQSVKHPWRIWVNWSHEW